MTDRQTDRQDTTDRQRSDSIGLTVLQTIAQKFAFARVAVVEPLFSVCILLGRLLVFCADTELTYLYRSQYVVCDGTFEMVPDTAYQLYPIHGFVVGEAMPLAWALLPNKSLATYTEMFNALRETRLPAPKPLPLPLMLNKRGLTATILRHYGHIMTILDHAPRTSPKVGTTV